MAETYTIYGGASVKWGVDDTHASGTVTSVDIDTEAKTEDCETATGAVNGIVVYDEEITATMTVVAGSAGALPTIGATITVDGNSMICVGCGKAKRHKDKVQFTIRCRKPKNLTLGGQ